MNHARALRNHLSEAALSRRLQTNHRTSRFVGDILGHRLAANSVLAGLGKELLLLLFVRKEVKSLPVENRMFLGLARVELRKWGAQAKLRVLVSKALLVELNIFGGQNFGLFSR